MPSLEGGYVFNSPKFLRLKDGNYRYFVLQHNNKILSRISFYCNGIEAISGYGATFGAFDWEKPIEAQEVQYFIDKVTDLLRISGIARISIRLPASAYPDVNLVEELLVKSNFKLSLSETNQHLSINMEAFENRIRYNEKKKLKQSRDAGYSFSILGLDSVSEVYALIATTRERKGYPVTMKFNELTETIKALQDQYLIFGLFDDNLLIAASISIRISDKILYNFYHADHNNYRTKSPLVMLVGLIYEYCQKENIGLLDLGISSDQGLLNDGLYKFKKNLGCVESVKNTLILSHA